MTADTGVARTLGRLAASAGSGMTSRQVRQWATHLLQQGGLPNRTRDRVQIILDDVRKRCAWVPDPTSERSVDPSQMVPNLLTGEGAAITFGDADDLAVVLAALLGSVGIRCELIGCGYGKDASITHVLVAYWDDEVEQWVNVDPSIEETTPQRSPTRTIALPVFALPVRPIIGDAP